ncbi:MAG: 3-phosphoshikimate 1-carboxyvinyltransferase, partial [Anaerolineaceae bacterium]|nr:3-phosphoshikimate 1-carboxyvinyltransferase [Anaerolineaceae bacterium]
MGAETVNRVSRPVVGQVRPPGSKSLTNRALVAAGLAAGRSVLTGCLSSDDTRYMAEAWRQLGATVDWDQTSGRAEITGTGGRLAPGPLELFVGNAGTAMRFLTAVVATGRGRYRLDGVERMHERPIEDLLVALRGLGASALSEAGTGCPPVVVEAGGLSGGQVTVSARLSSQYLSGLLLAAPYAAGDVEIGIDGDLVSKPYADLTCRLMADFGVEVECRQYER